MGFCGIIDFFAVYFCPLILFAKMFWNFNCLKLFFDVFFDKTLLEGCQNIHVQLDYKNHCRFLGLTPDKFRIYLRRLQTIHSICQCYFVILMDEVACLETTIRSKLLVSYLSSSPVTLNNIFVIIKLRHLYLKLFNFFFVNLNILFTNNFNFHFNIC